MKVAECWKCGTSSPQYDCKEIEECGGTAFECPKCGQKFSMHKDSKSIKKESK